MSTSTPWGPAQTAEKVGPGLMHYTTGSHGRWHPEKAAQFFGDVAAVSTWSIAPVIVSVPALAGAGPVTQSSLF